jgi:Mor family transcriptional regulator
MSRYNKCMRKPSKQCADVSSRNNEIVRDYQAGVSDGELGRRHGMSRQRIHQIVHDEARRTGFTPRKHICRVVPPVIPLSELAGLESGVESIASVCARLHVSVISVRKACAKHGITYAKHKPRDREVARRNCLIYESFMSGTSIDELAKIYGTTAGTICTRLARHRERTGAPPKHCGKGRWQA